MMKINDESKDHIINFGALRYEAPEMSNILDISEKDIVKYMEDENSEFSKLYKKGRDMANYVIDLKLFEMAKEGDIKALDKLDFRRKYN